MSALLLRSDSWYVARVLGILWVSMAIGLRTETSAIAQNRQNDQYAVLREQLINNVLIPNGIHDKQVLFAMNSTPRHEFVPREYIQQAYQDIAIPIGESQTISSPFIVAMMTQSLEPKPTDKVLEIGTGSGYQAAVLSPIVKDVYTIEIVEDLGAQTMQLLEDLDYKNVHCMIGDGFKGWKEHAPFDKIIVTCSPENVPEPLKEQLVEGGLMVIPVGERYQQMLYLMRKKKGKLEQEPLQPTLFVPMTGTAEDNRKVPPDPANPKLVNANFELPLIKNSHIPGWYYQFGCVLVQDQDAPDGKSVAEFRSTNPDLPSMLLQGIAIDGSVVRKIKLGGWMKLSNVKIGRDKEKSPSIAIQYFDEKRQRVGYHAIGGFKGTQNWKKVEKTFNIPPETKEAIISIGNFGAEGTARFDGIYLEVLNK